MQYIEWSRPKKVKNATDDQKMMFGLFFSLNQFVAKMDPFAAGALAHMLPVVTVIRQRRKMSLCQGCS